MNSFKLLLKSCHNVYCTLQVPVVLIFLASFVQHLSRWDVVVATNCYTNIINTNNAVKKVKLSQSLFLYMPKTSRLNVDHQNNYRRQQRSRQNYENHHEPTQLFFGTSGQSSAFIATPKIQLSPLQLKGIEHIPIVKHRLLIERQHQTSTFKLNENKNDHSQDGGGGNKNNNFSLEKFFNNNLYNSEIPDEIRNEIYDIESKTPAANGRSTRVTVYTMIAIVSIGLAFFNVFISDLKAGLDPEMPSIDEAGFTWVLVNPLSSFLFTNKIGGFILLLIGGASGLLAESELDSRRINSEKIYQELKRRKEQNETRLKSKGNNNNNNQQPPSRKQRKSKSKETKRIFALAEVLEPSTSTTTTTTGEIQGTINDSSPSTKINTTETIKPVLPVVDPTTVPPAQTTNPLFDSVKSFYQRADQMAAAQALLLNKELEERGLIEKITDDSGLRIIGKEQAGKQQQQQQQTRNNTDE